MFWENIVSKNYSMKYHVILGRFKWLINGDRAVDIFLMDWYMRMVQYVIQVQQLGLRVGAQKNRLNGIEVILF